MKKNGWIFLTAIISSVLYACGNETLEEDIVTDKTNGTEKVAEMSAEEKGSFASGS